ncbi:DUF4383 domain-containing protein [Georgenia halophila]
MSHPTTARRTAAHQWLALVVGVLYLAVGILGFFDTGFTGSTGFNEDDPSQTLWVFGINPLHNIVHVVVGGLGMVLWSRPRSARVFGWILVVGYGATAVYGFLVVDSSGANLLNINMADNWLHVGSVVVGLLIALWPRPAATEVPGHTEA